jgi:hypothetical protein
VSCNKKAVAYSYWLSCNNFTVKVSTDANDRVVGGAPLIRKFIGQPMSNLVRFAGMFGGVKLARLGSAAK